MVLAGDRRVEERHDPVAEVLVHHPAVTPAGPIRAGVGVHSRPAFLGVPGSGDRLDFSALGDTVTVAA